MERRSVSMLKKSRLYLVSAFLFLSSLGATPAAMAQESIYSFSGDVALASKYIWRGQRLTNDWSLQPAATVGIGDFSFNAWGTLDLAAVNEGDALPIPENPAAPEDANGLNGKFSEIDYTFSYAPSFESVELDFGAIIYTFPERSASLPQTTELYGGVTFGDFMLAPSAKLYIDVDETGDNGSTGMYFLLSAGHSIPLENERVSGVDLSVWITLVNSGFGEYYYGESESGFHDFNFTFGVPIALNDAWSMSGFVSYSALLGGFRDLQYLDPREVYQGTAGEPKDSADTFWGGITLSLAF
jgi:hypothetical protein